MKKAVVLVTVFRRYHELAANLKNTRERFQSELGYEPDVVLVWARPEFSRLWFIDSLRETGLVQYVLSRASLPGEGGGSTTYPESHSIQIGLKHCREVYQEKDFFILFHAADIQLMPGTVSFIHSHMQSQQAVVFHWENGCVRDNIWHTNCFGVSLENEAYWPPQSAPDAQDVLERQWGRKIQGLEGIHRWHNYASRMFKHQHLSEGLTPLAEKAVTAPSSLILTLSGWEPWYARLGKKLLGYTSYIKRRFFNG